MKGSCNLVVHDISNGRFPLYNSFYEAPRTLGTFSPYRVGCRANPEAPGLCFLMLKILVSNISNYENL